MPLASMTKRPGRPSFSVVWASLFWTLLSPASLLISVASPPILSAAATPTVDNAVATTVSALASAAGMAANSSDRAMDLSGRASSAAQNASRRVTDQALTASASPGALSAKGFPAPSVAAGSGSGSAAIEAKPATTTTMMTTTAAEPGALSAKGFPAPSVVVVVGATTTHEASTTTRATSKAATPQTVATATTGGAKDSVVSDAERALPLTWEEAYQKAEETLSKMTVSLLELSGLCPDQTQGQPLLFQQGGKDPSGHPVYTSQGLFQLRPRPSPACKEPVGHTRWVLTAGAASSKEETEEDGCTGIAYTSAVGGSVPIGKQDWHAQCGQNQSVGQTFEIQTVTLREVPQGEKYALLTLVNTETGLLRGQPELQKGFYLGNVAPIPRLNVPSLNMHGGATGFRPVPGSPANSSTYFPSPLALAATWDPALVEEVATSVAKEFKAKGANVLLGPSFNLNRDCRRSSCADRLTGEDPELGVRLAQAFVRGAQSQGVMVVAKHGLFHPDDDANDKFPHFDPLGSEAFESYYPAFEAAIEAGLGGIMPTSLDTKTDSSSSSTSKRSKTFLRSLTNSNGNSESNSNSKASTKSNSIGNLAAESSSSMGLEDTVLRDQLGFRGFVLQTDLRQSLAGGAGTDPVQDTRDDELESRALQVSAPESVDAAAKRILASAYRLRLDETTQCTPPACQSYLARNVTTAESAALARCAAAASMVLLKNKHDVLPLERSVKTIAVVGSASVITPHVPTGDLRDDLSRGVDASLDYPSPFDAILARAAANRAIVRGSPTDNPETAAQVSQDADVAIVFASAVPGEQDTMTLSKDIEKLVDATRKAARYTVVVVETPAALPLPWHQKVDAILIHFMAGQATSQACADLLFGDASPTARLPVAILESPSNVAYPFGHGMGFGKFEFSTPTRLPCESGDEECRFKFRSFIKNIGNRSASHVLEMYVTFPPEVGPVIRRLRSFKKSEVLAPGDEREVNFTLTRKDVSRWNRRLGDWEEATGTFSAELADSVVMPRRSIGFCHFECSIEKDGVFVIFGTMLGAVLLTAACLTLAVKKSPGHSGYKRVKEPALEPLDAPLGIITA